jgi:hypothetical protein
VTLNNRLSSLGSSVKSPAKLPSLQGARVSDPQVQKALESIREWLEVRLGSRGDPYERAVTQRDIDAALKPLEDAIDALGSFDGTIGSLRTDRSAQLPALRQGAFEQVGTKLYYCDGERWREVTLA